MGVKDAVLGWPRACDLELRGLWDEQFLSFGAR